MFPKEHEHELASEYPTTQKQLTSIKRQMNGYYWLFQPKTRLEKVLKINQNRLQLTGWSAGSLSLPLQIAHAEKPAPTRRISHTLGNLRTHLRLLKNVPIFQTVYSSSRSGQTGVQFWENIAKGGPSRKTLESSKANMVVRVIKKLLFPSGWKLGKFPHPGRELKHSQYLPTTLSEFTLPCSSNVHKESG